MTEDVKKLAADKLEKAGKLSDNMKRIVEHLQKRIAEDDGLTEDIANEKKDFTECMQYITQNARKLAKNGCAMVEDSTVYEWAEDYFRATQEDVDKVLTRKTSKTSAPKEVKPHKPIKVEHKEEPKTEEKAVELPKVEEKAVKPKKTDKQKDIEGQMSLFDFM